jgi:retinol dehydrogenase-12
VTKKTILYEEKTGAFIFWLISVIVFLGYLVNRLYFSGSKYKSSKRMDNRVAIITGANTGIGYQTTLDFARRGAHVIMACKDMKDAEKAAEEIVKISQNDRVEVEYLDLADLDMVRSFSHKMHSQFGRLDVLVNNAGVMVCPNWRTAQGHEMQLGVNHLGKYKLSYALVQHLKIDFTCLGALLFSFSKRYYEISRTN